MMSFMSNWFGPGGQEPTAAQIQILTDLRKKLNTPVADSEEHNGCVLRGLDASSSRLCRGPQAAVEQAVAGPAVPGGVEDLEGIRVPAVRPPLAQPLPSILRRCDSDDPKSDFRGGGELALRNLVYAPPSAVDASADPPRTATFAIITMRSPAR